MSLQFVNLDYNLLAAQNDVDAFAKALKKLIKVDEKSTTVKLFPSSGSMVAKIWMHPLKTLDSKLPELLAPDRAALFGADILAKHPQWVSITLGPVSTEVLVAPALPENDPSSFTGFYSQVKIPYAGQHMAALTTVSLLLSLSAVALWYRKRNTATALESDQTLLME